MSDLILTNTEGPVGVCTLNRPEVLNALNIALMDVLIERLEAFDADPAIRVIVIVGSEKAFAAGADIGEMADASLVDISERNNLARWKRVAAIRKPIIAGVSGFALGGGCELAMHCDMIVASESAQFGQPEIKLGVIPGAGGTQRLTRAVGKFRAMEIIMTGRFMTAKEAFDAGLVTKVVSKEQFLEETMSLAREIGKMPPLALKAAKEAILAVDNTTLATGLEYERRLFYSLFATEDQKEGMKAFQEKRKADFKGK
jgi:enoyl-CoA hydratase